ncbi:hypothetical protein F3Y22_tig00110013pilonHSYRG00194 [Hibiscus syriacus]|uniref:Uncharacterized protein n=1 Tax=Hibiscus syriacus TaxID=106335 RepID=A0A6A3BU88_HIBSY|nr:hypothetical protein F3Y22_tig00110013pilonHSYRG00194 [Hibiscus syriacus]
MLLSDRSQKGFSVSRHSYGGDSHRARYGGQLALLEVSSRRRLRGCSELGHLALGTSAVTCISDSIRFCKWGSKPRPCMATPVIPSHKWKKNSFEKATNRGDEYSSYYLLDSEDNQWIEDFSRGSTGIAFSSSAAEPCSISRCNNVWSEAVSSESVEMLLKSFSRENVDLSQEIHFDGENLTENAVASVTSDVQKHSVSNMQYREDGRVAGNITPTVGEPSNRTLKENSDLQTVEECNEGLPVESPRPTRGLVGKMTRFQDRARIFFAVLFWMSLFFRYSAWDGRNSGKPNEGSRFWKMS